MFHYLQESHFSMFPLLLPWFRVGEKKVNSDSRQISPKISHLMPIFKSKVMTYFKKSKLIGSLYLPKIMSHMSHLLAKRYRTGKGFWYLHLYLIPLFDIASFWVINHPPIKPCITPLNYSKKLLPNYPHCSKPTLLTRYSNQGKKYEYLKQIFYQFKLS